MKYKTALKIMRAIQREALEKSVLFREVAPDSWKWEYCAKCDCGSELCAPQTCFSVCNFTEKEINMLIRAAATLELSCRISTA